MKLNNLYLNNPNILLRYNYYTYQYFHKNRLLFIQWNAIKRNKLLIQQNKRSSRYLYQAKDLDSAQHMLAVNELGWLGESGLIPTDFFFFQVCFQLEWLPREFFWGYGIWGKQQPLCSGQWTSTVVNLTLCCSGISLPSLAPWVLQFFWLGPARYMLRFFCFSQIILASTECHYQQGER